MLRVPNYGATYFTIMGIDPGTDNLGVSLIRVDIATFKIISAEAFTLNGGRMVDEDCWCFQMYAPRTARIQALKKRLSSIIANEEPFLIASESPFYSQKHPQAYGALVEVLEMVKQVVCEYDKWKILWLIDPPSVKRAVGAAGNAKKDEVKAKVLAYPELYYTGEIPLGALDEHSIDSIGVAIACRARFLEEFQCLRPTPHK